MTTDQVDAIGPEFTAFLRPFERFFDTLKTVRHFRTYTRGLPCDRDLRSRGSGNRGGGRQCNRRPRAGVIRIVIGIAAGIGPRWSLIADAIARPAQHRGIHGHWSSGNAGCGSSGRSGRRLAGIQIIRA